MENLMNDDQEMELTLSKKEAQFLRDLLGNNIVGVGEVYQLATDIYEALKPFTKLDFNSETHGYVNVTNWKFNE